jgi:hypothetical protein
MAITQKVEPRTRRSNSRVVKPRPKSNRAGIRLEPALIFIQTHIKLIAFFALAVALFIGYNVLTGSRLFTVTHIEVIQASPTLRTDIEQTVKKTIAQNRLMDVDLAVVKREVEKIARVREATVARVLPDKIYVRVVERTPAVLVRRSSGNLIWVDIDAVEIGDFKLSDLKANAKANEATKMPPSAIGFMEGNSTSPSVVADNRERVALYKRLEQEFSAGQSLWDFVDEIDLSSLKYVSLQVTTSELVNAPLKIVLGNSDFRKRFERAIQVLRALKERDVEMLNVLRVSDAQRLIDNADRLNFLDATKESIVFSFSSPSTERMPNAGTQKPAANTSPTINKTSGNASPQQPSKAARAGTKQAAVSAPHAAAHKPAPAKKR